eukprot:scaffold5280_cov90-Skeletonema_dohrnii-CCMP3373.AAC.4
MAMVAKKQHNRIIHWSLMDKHNSQCCIQEIMMAINNSGNSSPSENRDHEDDSTTSEVTWPEIDGHLGDQLAKIHDPGYYQLSVEPEHDSPIPSVVSCIQHEDAMKENDRDVTSEFINEIVELKLQLANRRAEIDDLTASLNRCMLDNEALLAEKSVLVDEIAHYKQSGLDIDGSARSGLDGSSYSASSLRSSILSMGRRKSDQRKNGSIKMLLESNSQLLLQNSQLQIENNALRKSLQANILGNRRKRQEDQETVSNDVQQLQSGHKRGSFVTDKTANETLSVSSPMPEHWPALNDPYLDDIASDEMSSHASESWKEERNQRQKSTDNNASMWPTPCERDANNESYESSVAEDQDCDDMNIFSGIGNSWAYGMYPSFVDKRRSFPLGKRHSV